VFWLQPYLRLRVDIGLGLSMGLFGTADLWSAHRKACAEATPPHAPIRARRRLDLIVTVICVTLAGSELGLRALAALAPSPILEVGHVAVRERITGARYAPGTIRMSFPCNEGGYYDDEFTARRPDEHLVVAVGDSFSAGVVPQHFHYTTVAERELTGCRIHNMGLPGLNPLDYIYLIEHEARPLHPDLVVVSLFAGNDIIQGWPRRDPVRSWFDLGNVLVYQVPLRLIQVMTERRRTGGGPSVPDDPDVTVTSDPDVLVQRYPWLTDPLAEQPAFCPSGC
jgi:hypothetical protein